MVDRKFVDDTLYIICFSFWLFKDLIVDQSVFKMFVHHEPGIPRHKQTPTIVRSLTMKPMIIGGLRIAIIHDGNIRSQLERLAFCSKCLTACGHFLDRVWYCWIPFIVIGTTWGCSSRSRKAVRRMMQCNTLESRANFCVLSSSHPSIAPATLGTSRP